MFWLPVQPNAVELNTRILHASFCLSELKNKMKVTKKTDAQQQAL